MAPTLPNAATLSRGGLELVGFVGVKWVLSSQAGCQKWVLGLLEPSQGLPVTETVGSKEPSSR